MQKIGAALTLGLLLVAGCSGPQPTPEGSAPTSPATDAFEDEIEPMCAALQEKTAAAEVSATEAEFERLSGELLEEQRVFVTEARALEPPEDIAEAFSDYVDGLARFVELNEESKAATSNRDNLRITLEAAENGVATFEAKENADLPDSCPPSSGGEVYGFLFQAQANVSCFNLGAQLDKLGRLQATTDTREESAKLIRFMQRLASALVDGIEQSLPPEVRDAGVERMIRLYERRVELFDKMHDAFLAEDEAAYNRAFEEQERVFMQAERLAQSFGLTECLNFVTVGNS